MEFCDLSHHSRSCFDNQHWISSQNTCITSTITQPLQQVERPVKLQDLEEEKIPPLKVNPSEMVEVAVPDKYYKKFDFFYKRTCFRLFAEYFKQTFLPYQKQWIEQRRRTDLKHLIQEYASANF
jgi:hypothetical protein